MYCDSDADECPHFDRGTVINKDLLLECTEESEEGYEKGDWPHVRRIRMSFKGIVDIINLDLFIRLEFLCLSNNRIRTLSTLPPLPSLMWLDVSFNLIVSFPSMDQTTFPKLQNLCLFSNMIESIESIPSFCNLEVLSLGYNKLQSIEDAISNLRRLPSLVGLNILGNPLNSQESQIRLKSALPGLKYLNNELIHGCTFGEIEIQ